MEPDEITDEVIWRVLQHIKKLGYFHSSYGPIICEAPSEIDKGALLYLQDLKAIKLLNLSRFSTPSIIQDYSSESGQIKLEIVQPGFNDIYKDFKMIIGKNDIELPTASEASHEPDGTKSRKEVVTDTIKICKLKGKGKKLLRVLDSFKPVSESKIIDQTLTNNLKSLLFDVRKKIKRSSLVIDTIDPKHWEEEAFYQLKFRP